MLELPNVVLKDANTRLKTGFTSDTSNIRRHNNLSLISVFVFRKGTDAEDATYSTSLRMLLSLIFAPLVEIRLYTTEDTI